MKQLSLLRSSRNVFSYRVTGNRRCRVRAAPAEAKDVTITPSIEDSGTGAEVTFKLQKHVDYGQYVCLTGAVDALGCWEPQNSVPLDWSDGDLWTVACQLPAGAALEYKYIIRSGNKVVWQPGENLTIQVPEEAGQINDVWPGEGRSEGDLAVATGEEASLDAPEALHTETAAAIVDVSMVGAPNSNRSLPLLTATSPDVAPGSMLHQTLEEELEKTSIESFSVDKLKGLLNELGLPVKGRKEQMVQRLKEAQDMARPMPKNGRSRSAA